jgi:heme exporter protein B
MQPIFYLLQKELLLEWRQKHSLYGVILYISATIYVLYLSLQDVPDSNTWNSLFWVIQLFVCVNAVAKSFLQENRGRMLYYYSLVSPSQFVAAKLLYNALLMMLMSVISLALFYLFLESPVQRPLVFVGVTLLGGIGISLVFTLMSAIAARAQQNAALMAILGFPVILPQLMLMMRLSKVAFAEVFREGAVWQLTGYLLIMDVLVVVLASILYPFLWRD